MLLWLRFAALIFSGFCQFPRQDVQTRKIRCPISQSRYISFTNLKPYGLYLVAWYSSGCHRFFRHFFGHSSHKIRLFYSSDTLLSARATITLSTISKHTIKLQTFAHIIDALMVFDIDIDLKPNQSHRNPFGVWNDKYTQCLLYDRIRLSEIRL